MEATPFPGAQGPPPPGGPELPMWHRPSEHSVRDAMHRLEDRRTHHFTVPIVTPQSAPPPQASGDW
ncbi:hypothetical protein [Candidatus Solirubrobacter pratensis]|uniref:hypothetical protein n=1 Tax=Candidatus Solirubrobacter pratensis TaxID=1298857 RepID=UPI0012DE2ADA|nr:hypothetical protein [Candidatus Solirubrobacter pratensis]